jgi:hypothetical protein
MANALVHSLASNAPVSNRQNSDYAPKLDAAKTEVAVFRHWGGRRKSQSLTFYGRHANLRQAFNPRPLLSLAHREVTKCAPGGGYPANDARRLHPDGDAISIRQGKGHAKFYALAFARRTQPPSSLRRR